MTTEYNLEAEERFLKSYLQKTTAVSINQRDDYLGEFGAQNVDNKKNEYCDRDNDDLIGKRVFCCKTSRSLYCPECCRVLVPKECWPQRFISHQCNNNSQQQAGWSFPFNFMDIILGVKERRTSSTGIQMMCISNMVAEVAKSSCKNSRSHQDQQEGLHYEFSENKTESTTTTGCEQDGNNGGIEGGEWWRNIKLYDLNRGDTLPTYSTTMDTRKMTDGENEAAKENEAGTYVLFPQEGKSVPISAVANKIKRLVVLDIKWTRSNNVQLFSANHHKITASRPSEGGGGKSYNPLAPLQDLPFVHLEYPPQNSHFWRWHNRGVGMLSTIEAIYFAAREVSVTLQQRQDIGDEEKDDDNSNDLQQGSIGECDDDKNYVDILWLFALQRSIIQECSLKEGRPVAFSEEAKAMARALRKQNLPEKENGAGGD